MIATDELLLASPAARPCTHVRANHQHGTRQAYEEDRCRCRSCSQAHSDYARHRYRQLAYGRWQPFADPAEARAHVEALMRAGLSWRTVAHRAGLDDETVKALMYGRDGSPVPRIRTSTATKLLAVKAGRRRMPRPPDLLSTEAIT